MARSGSSMSTAWSISCPPGPPSRPDRPITLAVKCAGTRSAGNPHATCDVAGVGNGALAVLRSHRASPRPYHRVGWSPGPSENWRGLVLGWFSNLNYLSGLVTLSKTIEELSAGC